MNKATRLLIWAFFNIFFGIVVMVIGAIEFKEVDKWYDYIMPSLIWILGLWYFVEGMSMGRKSIKID